jgi:hypothetical protein
MVSVRVKELMEIRFVYRYEEKQLASAQILKRTIVHLCSLTNHGKNRDGSSLTSSVPIGSKRIPQVCSIVSKEWRLK